MVRTAGYSEKYVPRQTGVGDDPLGRVKAITPIALTLNPKAPKPETLEP